MSERVGPGPLGSPHNGGGCRCWCEGETYESEGATFCVLCNHEMPTAPPRAEAGVLVAEIGQQIKADNDQIRRDDFRAWVEDAGLTPDEKVVYEAAWWVNKAENQLAVLVAELDALAAEWDEIGRDRNKHWLIPGFAAAALRALTARALGQGGEG